MFSPENEGADYGTQFICWNEDLWYVLKDASSLGTFSAAAHNIQRLAVLILACRSDAS